MEKKVAVITGGTRGIGLGIGKVFLANGYKVALIYRSDTANAARVSKALASDDVCCIKADITHKEKRETLFAEVERGFGRVDILVNNAGIIHLGRLIELEEDIFNAVIQCNLQAPIFLAKVFANTLIRNKSSGSIINILSVGAYRTGNLAYCTAKAGLLMATKCMARELAKHHIRVNSISPFGVETDLNRASREKNPEAWNELIKKKTALQRAADPEEIGNTVFFLASDAASYITGVDIPVDGGHLSK